MAIYDTMHYIKCDVSTVCIGMAASMGSFLLAGGAKGKRFALPNAEIMIHQPSGGARGQATEIEIAAKHILRTREKLNHILAENTGRDYELVCADTERDNWMSAEEAKEYGIIDMVLSSHDVQGGKKGDGIGKFETGQIGRRSVGRYVVMRRRCRWKSGSGGSREEDALRRGDLLI